jgi:hypothetical protein
MHKRHLGFLGLIGAALAMQGAGAPVPTIPQPVTLNYEAPRLASVQRKLEEGNYTPKRKKHHAKAARPGKARTKGKATRTYKAKNKGRKY